MARRLLYIPRLTSRDKQRTDALAIWSIEHIVDTGIESGQRRHAKVDWRLLVVDTLRPSTRNPGHWICLAEPDYSPMLIADGELGDLVLDPIDGGSEGQKPGGSLDREPGRATRIVMLPS
jgi:hypothetical protein